MKASKPSRPGEFVIVWEFHVQSNNCAAFERAYGQQGDWAKLFRTSSGYIRTDLIRDMNSPNRYLTLDHWQSSRQYENFRRKNREEYLVIDRVCESLTTNEVEIGRFTIKS